MSGNHFLKTDLFLTCGNSLSSQWKPFSSIASDIFQEVLHTNQRKHIFQYRRKNIVFYLELLIDSSFLLTKIITDMSGNHFLKTDLFLTCGNSLSSQWKPFSSIASDIFQEVLHTNQRKHIFQYRRKNIVFYLELFSCQWKPLFKLQGSLCKTLITAIGNNFL